MSNLQKEVAANGQALDTAIGLRQKELAEFVAEEKDSVQSISGLKAAIVAISKHHASMLEGSAERKQVADMLGSHMGRYKKILAWVVTPSQKKKVTAFLQSTNSSASQGGEIFGILTNMKESFEARRMRRTRSQPTMS